MDEVHLVRRRDGRLHGTILIHGRADAEMVTEVFDRLAAPDDHRTLAQRRAEVLLDLTAHATSPTGIPGEGSASDDTDLDHTDNADDADRGPRPNDEVRTASRRRGSDSVEPDADTDEQDDDASATDSAPPSGPSEPMRGKRVPGRPAVPPRWIDPHQRPRPGGHASLLTA